MIIAIDGPAASGKSTVARAVARRLGFEYLDTGAMYRAVAFGALQRDVRLEDEGALALLARCSLITFGHEDDDPVPTKTYFDGHDVTEAIRTPEVDAAVSAVARVPGVRDAMVVQQRRMAQESGDVILEGRDIGTVVFPDAEVKVFLWASPEERSRRRHVQLSDAGHELDHDEVAERLERRDEIDSSREASPLPSKEEIAEHAHVIDTTGLTLGDVIAEVLRLVEEAR